MSTELKPDPAMQRSTCGRLVIGIQKGPTSACKMGPPGFKGTRFGSVSRKIALVSHVASWLRCGRRVKRRWALRGRNPPRDSLADGVPPGTWLRGSNHARGAFFLPLVVTGVHASKNPGGLGAEPPGQYPARRLNSSPDQPCGSSWSSSTRGSGSFRHSSRRCGNDASSDPAKPLSSVHLETLESIH